MSEGKVWLQPLYGMSYMSYLPLLLAWAQNKVIWGAHAYQSAGRGAYLGETYGMVGE